MHTRVAIQKSITFPTMSRTVPGINYPKLQTWPVVRHGVRFCMRNLVPEWGNRSLLAESWVNYDEHGEDSFPNPTRKPPGTKAGKRKFRFNGTGYDGASFQLANFGPLYFGNTTHG